MRGAVRQPGRPAGGPAQPADSAGKAVSRADGPRPLALNLTRTKAGTLQFGDQRYGFLLDGLLELDGLSYTGLPGLGDVDRVGPGPAGSRGLSRPVRRVPGPRAAHVAQWLWWFRECSAGYRAQPYEALAAAYGGAGHDDLARRILVAQRDDVRDRGSLSPVRKLGQHGAKWLIGYGYHCFYALLWLAGLFTVTALLALFWLGPDKYIVEVPAAGTAAAAAGRPPPRRPPACPRQPLPPSRRPPPFQEQPPPPRSPRRCWPPLQRRPARPPRPPRRRLPRRGPPRGQPPRGQPP